MPLPLHQQSYTQLCQKVEELSGRLALMRREYEDLFYNLTFDNLEPNVRKPITATIKEVYPDGRTKESSIVQSAKEIRTEVRQVYAIKEYSGDGDPGSRDRDYIWKNTDTDKYYVFHERKDEKGVWVETETDEIKTAFIQTDTGFTFDGTVEINGDLITYGTISGDRIQGGTITGTTIEGGTINGGEINVNTDLQVGNSIFIGKMGDQDTDKLIRFNDTANIQCKYDQIKLNAQQIFHNSKRIATESDIENLQQQINALQRG